MAFEVLSKEEVVSLIKEYYPDRWLNRKEAAKHLCMAISTFDEFIRENPHLRHRNKGRFTRFRESELNKAFERTELKIS